jgi:hypothetical protein
VIICTAGAPETSNWEQLSFVSGKVGQVAAWGTAVLGEIFCSIKMMTKLGLSENCAASDPCGEPAKLSFTAALSLLSTRVP